MKKSKQFLFNISIIFASFFVSIYFIEISIVTYNQFQNNKYEIKKENKVEYLKKISKNNKNIVVAIPPANSFDNIYPLAGLSKKMTINCNENGYWSKYKSDRYGFNNLDIIWDFNKIDYLFIGDSFTLGSCVGKKNNFVSIIDDVKKTNSLNLGMMGTGPIKQLAILKEYGYITKPKKIFWIFYEGNDFRELEEEFNNKVLRKYLDGNFLQGLSNKQIIIDQKLKIFFFKKLNEKLNEKLINQKKIDHIFYNIKLILKITELRKLLEKTLNSKFINRKDYFNDENLITYKKTLVEFLRVAKNMNTEVSIIFIPSKDRLLKLNPQSNTIINKSEFLKIFNEFEVKIIDIDEFFKSMSNEEKKTLYSYGAVHFNNNGYLLISNYILSKINN